MGERGPLPAATVRRRNKPQATIGQITIRRPSMPSNITEEAKRAWRRVVPELEEMGILARVDRDVLLTYCTAWSDWQECTAKLAATGLLVRGQKGNLVRNPLWLMRESAMRTVVETGKLLGLSPSARLRARIKHVRAAPATEIDPEVASIDAYRKMMGAG